MQPDRREARSAAQDRDRTAELIADATSWFATRKTAAQDYAAGLRYHRDEIDWPKVNSAIIERWSVSALAYIKREAWKQLPGSVTA